MNTENRDKPLTGSVISKDKEAEEDDFNSSTAARDLEEYVKVMTSLRGGTRPILCW